MGHRSGIKLRKRISLPELLYDVFIGGELIGFVWPSSFKGATIWCSSGTGSARHANIRVAIRELLKFDAATRRHPLRTQHDMTRLMGR